MATLTTTSVGVTGGVADVRSYLLNLKFLTLTFTPSTSYATNGDTIPAGAIPGGLKVADFLLLGQGTNIVPLNAPIGTGTYTPVLDYTNSKLKLLTTSTGAEVANATNTQTVLGSNPVTLVFLVKN